MTRTKLGEEGLVVPPAVKPAGCYLRTKMEPRVVYLFDKNETTKRPSPTAAQIGNIAKANAAYAELHTCKVCGRRSHHTQSRHGMANYLSYVEDGLCGQCRIRQQAEDRAEEILAVADLRRVLILDTETTGLNKTGSDEVLELSVIDATGTLRLTSLARPQDMTRSWPEAERVHHISHEMLAEAPDFPSVFGWLTELLGQADLVLTYNIEFDFGVLRDTAKRYGLRLPDGKWECASQLFARWYGEWSEYFHSFKFRSQEVACSELAVPRSGEGAHRAEYDCRLTLGVLQAMAARAQVRKARASELATVAVEEEKAD